MNPIIMFLIVLVIFLAFIDYKWSKKNENPKNQETEDNGLESFEEEMK